jgi:hypothetical protein
MGVRILVCSNGKIEFSSHVCAVRLPPLMIHSPCFFICHRLGFSLVPRFGVLQFLVKATGQVTCFLLLYACVSIGEFSCGLQQLFSASISSTPPVVSVASFSFCLPHSTDYVLTWILDKPRCFLHPVSRAAASLRSLREAISPPCRIHSITDLGCSSLNCELSKDVLCCCRFHF